VAVTDSYRNWLCSGLVDSGLVEEFMRKGEKNRVILPGESVGSPAAEIHAVVKHMLSTDKLSTGRRLG
jgi:hypothetical protein